MSSAASPAAVLKVTGVSAGFESTVVWHDATTGDNKFIGFLTEGGAGTERGNITYNRAGGLVAYNTSSDQRLKNDLGILTDTSVLAGTKIHKFTWKETGNESVGVFAQETYLVNPLAVSVGADDTLDANGLPKHPWSVDYSRYVPNLIVGWQAHQEELEKAHVYIQQLNERVKVLEMRLSKLE